MEKQALNKIIKSAHKFLITLRSGNKKTGPIMVVTSPRSTCPKECPFMKSGCYANAGPLGLLWTTLDKGEADFTAKLPTGANLKIHSLDSLIAAVKAQPVDALWRMNQAGDLPGEGSEIDTKTLAEIVTANEGRRGFTYTHKPMTPSNAAAVKAANENGFTINLSANTLAHADTLSDLNIGPVVAVMPAEATENARTPAGRKVVVCPATQRDDVSCATCGLCQRQRECIVGFPAHGASIRKADAIARS